MDAKIKKRLLKEWFSGETRKLAEIAIERIESKNPFAFVNEKTTRSKEIDDKKFFGDIDRIIKFLGKLKAEGYTRVVQHWYGYEENGFLAEKADDESEEEMLRRFYDIVEEKVCVLEREIEERDKKKAEIAALKKKITELEKGL